MLDVIVPPLAAAYVVFVAMVIAAHRRPDLRPYGRAYPFEHSRGRWADHVVGTTAGGYVAFLGIVLVFHVWLAGEHDAFGSAVWGGGFLAVVALGLSAGQSAIRGRRRRRE